MCFTLPLLTYVWHDGQGLMVKAFCQLLGLHSSELILITGCNPNPDKNNNNKKKDKYLKSENHFLYKLYSLATFSNPQLNTRTQSHTSKSCSKG